MVTMTPAEVAAKFGVKLHTVYSWVRRGKISAARYGRDLHIPVAEVKKHLRRKR